MNALVALHDGQAVTTSLAIAEGTENEHRAVLQLIRTHQTSLETFGRVAFEMQPFDTAGGMQRRDVAMLNEQQATLLLTMMRNSPIVLAFKVRLVKAFYEMAARAAAQVANLSRLDLLRMAMEAEEHRLALEQQVSTLEPKAIALDRFAGLDGLHNLRSAAKLLGIRERTFTTWLIGNRWCYRDHGGRLCAYADRLASGYLDTIPVEIRRSDGIQAVAQPVVTQKGLARLAVVLAKEGLITPVDIDAITTPVPVTH